jgi:hypothetical protein
MKQKLTYAGVIAVVVVVALAVYAMWRPANNANFPEGTDWICTNQACKTTFKLTMKQLGEHHKAHYGEPVPCPKCGQRAIRADKCAFCGKIYPQIQGNNFCPYCKKEQPPLVTD